MFRCFLLVQFYLCGLQRLELQGLSSRFVFNLPEQLLPLSPVFALQGMQQSTLPDLHIGW
jgi:hypothetical protein